MYIKCAFPVTYEIVPSFIDLILKENILKMTIYNKAIIVL